MKAYILYSHPSDVHGGSPVIYGDKPICYVRAEVVECDDINMAVSKARSMPGEVILSVIPKYEVRIEEGGVYASKYHDSVVLCSVTYNGDSYALMGRGAKVHSTFTKVFTRKEVEAYIIANNLKYYGNVSEKIKDLLREATKNEPK